MTAQDVGRLAKRAGWDVVGLEKAGATLLLCWRAYDGYKVVAVGAAKGGAGGGAQAPLAGHAMPVTCVGSLAEAAVVFGVVSPEDLSAGGHHGATTAHRGMDQDRHPVYGQERGPARMRAPGPHHWHLSGQVSGLRARGQ